MFNLGIPPQFLHCQKCHSPYHLLQDWSREGINKPSTQVNPTHSKGRAHTVPGGFAATWVGTNLTGLGFDGASFLGEKALIQYFKGGNTEKLYINVTTPLFLDFLPAFDEAGTPNGTVQFYTLWLLLPRAIWDDPPEPTAPIGFPTPEVLAVKYFWTYTRTFSGFAFESNVLKQIQKLNETLLADGVDTSQPGTGWVFSRYSPDVSGPPNEIHYSGAGRAPKHLLDKASRR
eukprot:jgi/Botrbrau1/2343/Bobra.39_1s0031.1